MEKTKLGIPVTLAAVAMCLLGWFGGLVIAGIFAGYILLQEENTSLRRLAVKVLAVMFLFSTVSYLLGLPNDVMHVLYSLLNVVGIDGIYVEFVSELTNFLSNVWSLLRTVVFLLMAANVASGKDFKIPVVDNLLDKYMAD